MPKPTLNQSAVAAVAYAALASYPRKLGYEAEWNQPERVARELLGVGHEGFSEERDFSLALDMYDAGFAFALQLGARIGADPLQHPEIKDLVENHRLEREEAA